jgi:iron-sulfur cluster repair protein YtfE (RIC family)
LLGLCFTAIEDGDRSSTYSALDMFWARLAMHIRAEHLHLFPAVLSDAEDAEVEQTIRSLHDDHDFFMRELVTSIKLMRSADSADKKVLATVREHLESVQQRLITHNRIEEQQIYRIADRLSGTLIVSIEKEITNLPPRFAAGSK